MSEELFREWWGALKIARSAYTNRRDLKAWTFFFDWACEVHDAYDAQYKSSDSSKA